MFDKAIKIDKKFYLAYLNKCLKIIISTSRQFALFFIKLPSGNKYV